MAEAPKLELDVAEAKREVEASPPTVEPADLESRADELVERLVQLEPGDARAREERAEAVRAAGREVQKRAAHQSRMLEEPIRNLAGRSEDGGQVAQNLVDLRTQVEELDPNRFDFEGNWLSRLLGALPFVGPPARRYFAQYESAQSVIDGILRSLEEGREQLRRDNVTLGEDQKALRELGVELERQVRLLQRIDEKLAHRIEREVPESDPRHQFLTEEVLFPLRQRIQDLQQQLAVNRQGVLAMELVIRNNRELVRGVDSAMEVTVGALQVAVTVALALAHQKLVLDKVTALNRTTSDLIAGTAARLRTQGAEIHRQSAGAMLDVEKLKAAFADVHAAMDEVARFRKEALPKMAENIRELDELNRASGRTIERLEEGGRAKPAEIALEP